MKKISILLLVLCCVNSVFAQWSVTPEAGVAAVKRIGTDDWSARVRAGVGVEYDLSKLFSIKSGLYYANRGFSHNSMYMLAEEGTNADAIPVFSQIKPSQGYLQIPLLAKFNWNICGDVRFNVAIGPYLGYRIHTGGDELIYSAYNNNYGDYGYGDYGNGNYGDYGYGGYGVVSHDLPEHGGYKFDWGANLAVGMEVKNWVMNLTYESALGKEFKHDEVKTKYYTLGLTLGYKFRL